MLFIILKNSVYFIWLLFFFWLLTWGQEELVRLLHPRLWWVVGAAFLIIFIFLLNSVIFEHSYQGERSLSTFFSIIILLVPVAFYFIAKDTTFDSASLQKRGIQGEDGFVQGGMPLEMNGLKYGNSSAVFSNLLRAPEEYVEEEVEVICRSFVDAKLPENMAMCYRYLMTCCAADAIPLFIFLSHPENLDIENDRWLKTKGKVGLIEKNGVKMVRLDISTFEYTEEPAIPWVL